VRRAGSPTGSRREFEFSVFVDRYPEPLNEEGLFNVEYADVLGIPFDFTAKPVIAPPQPPRQTIQVKAVRPERDALAVLPRGAATIDSNDIAAGQTYLHTFTVPGTYHYFCEHHETHGMVGTVIVGR